METSPQLGCSLLKVVFSILKVIAIFVDVGLDVWAVIKLFSKENYVAMGLLIFILVGSSCLMQVFSWISYSDHEVVTKTEKFVKQHKLLELAHILQLGVFLRSVGAVEINFCNHHDVNRNRERAFSKCELSLLAIFETFTESAPQLILMTTIVVQQQELQLYSVAKIIGSLVMITFRVVSYHRSMRVFAQDNCKMGWAASVVFFLWNLLLIASRVISVALFASVLPCYVAAHFLVLWMLLLVWAWWNKTSYMHTKKADWLYRATVGIIWYFSWFNVVCKKNTIKSIIYHICMGLDNVLLLSLWWWKRSVESARLHPLPLNPYAVIAIVSGLYLSGFLLRVFYYQAMHTKKADFQIIDELREDPEILVPRMSPSVEADSTGTPEREPELEPELEPDQQVNLTGFHRRMKRMAENFYC